MAYARRLVDIAQGINRQNTVSGVRVNRTTRGDSVIPNQTGGGGGGGGGGVSIKRYILKDVKPDYLICNPPPKGPPGSAPRWLGQLVSDPADEAENVPSENDAYYNVSNKTFKIYLNGSWAAMTPSATVINVAKPPELRTSLFGERIIGGNQAYTYNDGTSETWAVGTRTDFNIKRTSTQGAATENQLVTRPWIENEMIFAALVGDTGASFHDANNQLVLLKWQYISPARQWAKV